MNEPKRFTFFRFSLALLLTGFLLLFWTAPFRVGQVYEHLDSISGYIVRGDKLATQEELGKLDYFYRLNKKLEPLRLNGFLERRLFLDTIFHQAAFDYLAGYNEKAIEKLKNGESFWAYYIRANARWRMAQGAYRQALKIKDPEARKKALEQAKEMARSTKDDYEKAVRNDPKHSLPPPWDYDLVNNEGAMENALRPAVPKIKVVLGLGGGKNKKGVAGEKGDGPGKGSKDLGTKGDKESKGKPGAKRTG